MLVPNKSMWGRPPSAVRRAKPGSVRERSAGVTPAVGTSRLRVSKHESLQMRIKPTLVLLALLALPACSPRDFLTRRLATDLIAASPAFRAQQKFVLQTGIVSNQNYVAPENLVLEHHGWISVAPTRCSPGLTPPPCWDIQLTPAGVDTIHYIIPAEQADRSSLEFPVARRELLQVTGITKDGNQADVDFIWKWAPLNEVGAALYSPDLHYTSTVGFRHYDDGWRIAPAVPHPAITLDDALNNAEPIQ